MLYTEHCSAVSCNLTEWIFNSEHTYVVSVLLCGVWENTTARNHKGWRGFSDT